MGTGFSSITLATDNDFLRSLGEVGFLGTSAFGLIIVSILLRTKKFIFNQKKLILEDKLIIGLTGACIGFLANALFIDVFEASKVAITFLVDDGNLGFNYQF